MLADIMASGTLAPELLDSYLTFIPKSSSSSALPSDVRPLNLNNILSKIFPGLLSRQFLLRDDWCCLVQHGVGGERGTAFALLALEAHALKLARRHPAAHILFADLESAFPSFKRQWLSVVLQASGCLVQLHRDTWSCHHGLPSP